MMDLGDHKKRCIAIMLMISHVKLNVRLGCFYLWYPAPHENILVGHSKWSSYFPRVYAENKHSDSFLFIRKTIVRLLIFLLLRTKFLTNVAVG